MRQDRPVSRVARWIGVLLIVLFALCAMPFLLFSESAEEAILRLFVRTTIGFLFGTVGFCLLKSLSQKRGGARERPLFSLKTAYRFFFGLWLLFLLGRLQYIAVYTLYGRSIPPFGNPFLFFAPLFAACFFLLLDRNL